MGPSGSGKTSLLNALAGRIEVTKEAELTGEITVNGEDATDFLANHSAYIMQDDALFALSTVFETLMFVAQLRLPKTMPIADKKARVVEVITELGLITSKDTLVGNQRVRGLSGGERKRLNIGVDMLHNPRLLFCDEPTSGWPLVSVERWSTSNSHSVTPCSSSRASSASCPRIATAGCTTRSARLDGCL